MTFAAVQAHQPKSKDDRSRVRQGNCRAAVCRLWARARAMPAGGHCTFSGKEPVCASYHGPCRGRFSSTRPLIPKGWITPRRSHVGGVVADLQARTQEPATRMRPAGSAQRGQSANAAASSVPSMRWVTGRWDHHGDSRRAMRDGNGCTRWLEFPCVGEASPSQRRAQPYRSLSPLDSSARSSSCGNAATQGRGRHDHMRLAAIGQRWARSFMAVTGT